MNYDFLKNNPRLKNISPEKLDFILSFAQQNFKGNANDMAKELSFAASNAKSQGITFNNDETEILIEILKQQMSPEEQKKADRIMHLLHTFKPKETHKQT